MHRGDVNTWLTSDSCPFVTIFSIVTVYWCCAAVELTPNIMVVSSNDHVTFCYTLDMLLYCAIIWLWWLNIWTGSVLSFLWSKYLKLKRAHNTFLCRTHLRNTGCWKCNIGSNLLVFIWVITSKCTSQLQYNKEVIFINQPVMWSLAKDPTLCDGVIIRTALMIIFIFDSSASTFSTKWLIYKMPQNSE